MFDAHKVRNIFASSSPGHILKAENHIKNSNLSFIDDNKLPINFELKFKFTFCQFGRE